MSHRKTFVGVALESTTPDKMAISKNEKKVDGSTETVFPPIQIIKQNSEKGNDRNGGSRIAGGSRISRATIVAKTNQQDKSTSESENTSTTNNGHNYQRSIGRPSMIQKGSSLSTHLDGSKQKVALTTRDIVLNEDSNQSTLSSDNNIDLQISVRQPSYLKPGENQNRKNSTKNGTIRSISFGKTESNDMNGNPIVPSDPKSSTNNQRRSIIGKKNSNSTKPKQGNDVVANVKSKSSTKDSEYMLQARKFVHDIVAVALDSFQHRRMQAIVSTETLHYVRDMAQKLVNYSVENAIHAFETKANR
jgi:hypothetical protein